MEIEIKTIKLDDIKLNPDNPRTITGKAMKNLVKSLKEFPDMLELREIVVDETMTVMGGNMRLLALQKTSAKDCTVKIVSRLTPEQKREFIIKDNAGFGEWDFDALANGWDDLPLVDWGVDFPKAWGSDSGKDGVGELTLEQKFMIVIECDGEEQQIELLTKFQGENLNCKALIS